MTNERDKLKANNYSQLLHGFNRQSRAKAKEFHCVAMSEGGW